MLRITLRDGEKAVINGAVIKSVGRTQLAVENRVAILRGSEVMRPEDAVTPAEQLYFTCMLAYIDADGRDAHQERVVDLLRAVLAQGEDEIVQRACVRFANALAVGDHYRALHAARDVIAQQRAATAQAA